MWRAREQSCCTVTWANRCRRRLPRLSSHAPRYVPHAARCTLELLQRHNYPSTSSAKALRMSNDSLAGKWTTLQLQLELPARVASSHLAQIRLRTPRHLAFSCQCLSLSLPRWRREFAFCQVTNVVLIPFSLFFSLFPIFLPRLKPLSRLVTAALMAEIYRQQQIEAARERERTNQMCYTAWRTSCSFKAHSY